KQSPGAAEPALEHVLGERHAGLFQKAADVAWRHPEGLGDQVVIERRIGGSLCDCREDGAEARRLDAAGRCLSGAVSGRAKNRRNEIDDVEPEAVKQLRRKRIEAGRERSEIALQQRHTRAGCADRLARNPLRLLDKSAQGAAIDAEQRDLGALRFAGVEREAIINQEPVAGADARPAAIVAEALPAADEQAEQGVVVAIAEMALRPDEAAGRAFEEAEANRPGSNIVHLLPGDAVAQRCDFEVERL